MFAEYVFQKYVSILLVRFRLGKMNSEFMLTVAALASVSILRVSEIFLLGGEAGLTACWMSSLVTR